MKHQYFILFVVLISANIVSAQKSFYTLPFTNTGRLPSLEVLINMDEMAASYQTGGEVWNTQYTDTEDETSEVVSTSYQNNEKLVDATRFLKHYLFVELLDYSEVKSGSVEMKVSYFEQNARASVGSAINILTLGFAVFFGCPTHRNVVDLEVEATFYDKNGKYISKYTGVGRASSAENLYNHTARKAHKKALANAITNLNSQIMADSRLRERLALN